MSTTTSPACVHPVANYHSAFPALQSLPWSHSTLPHSKKRPSIPNSTFSQSLSPPKPPAYLKHTQYAALVREQYQYLLQKRYENTKKLVNDTPQHEQMTNNDILSELDLRLPSFWNAADKSRYLEIDKNGLGVTYIGPGKCEDHAGTVRANFPMRNQCGVYYFEMHVKSKGDDGYIGIGFCSAKNELKRLPGWDKKSFGYHGDDGHSFEGSGIGKKYGPQFKTGDVIGCGVNFASKTAFYTKNGSSLGVAFQDLDVSQPLYPCVGMRTADEYITVNFGQEPFVYDIVQYIQEQKLYLWKDIGTYSLSSNIPMMIKPNSMDKLVLSYLIHHGYSGTAQALTRDSAYLTDQDGDNYILFQLKCQKFVEMISDHSDQEYEGRQRTTINHQRRYSEVDSMVSFSSEDDHTSILSCSSQTSSMDGMMTDDGSLDSSIQQMMQTIMMYGQQLQGEYGKDPSAKIKDKLKQIFSLLAYPDPRSSPMGHLMDKVHRETLASDVNVAILGKSSKKKEKKRERIATLKKTN
ncbi:concanavalin A-like lectin/glucanase domain-containing protein [Halteromyces radiatus]|uniref:concanavalin A-like lectin/glucanase domain-containing protein n=1 Tax=Halteromyces radiatus TaxID=101107 RepID=UPI0022209F39|nr:concanavalin A-like lectin/glucanase domain-containing protein [Halteromyces radiatus]KAI8093573.1 concanavalin A-like lectin/glucanase domain-containing protein [Halteromyces radiatus]